MRFDELFTLQKNRPKALNTGCMINNYSPASLSELILNNAKLGGEVWRDEP